MSAEAAASRRARCARGHALMLGLCCVLAGCGGLYSKTYPTVLISLSNHSETMAVAAYVAEQEAQLWGDNLLSAPCAAGATVELGEYAKGLYKARVDWGGGWVTVIEYMDLSELERYELVIEQ